MRSGGVVGLPNDLVGRMETIAARLVPSPPIDRHADRFNAHPRFTDLALDSPSDCDVAVRKVRRVAVRRDSEEL